MGPSAIRQGVARDGRVSIEDVEMRYGRKSRSRRFDSYKEHIVRDLDFPVIVVCTVTPANRPANGEGPAPIAKNVQQQGLRLETAPTFVLGSASSGRRR
ncbi:hypothetical protein [Sorangium sp. So ce128]|uniref:hypothetical protein n=1 Tax=Sorangium sp. So ce128 TaxID=3133281 RepID=UPI003F62CCD8